MKAFSRFMFFPAALTVATVGLAAQGAGEATKDAAKKTGSAVSGAAKTTGKATAKGAEATASGAKKLGTGVASAVTGGEKKDK